VIARTSPLDELAEGIEVIAGLDILAGGIGPQAAGLLRFLEKQSGEPSLFIHVAKFVRDKNIVHYPKTAFETEDVGVGVKARRQEKPFDPVNIITIFRNFVVAPLIVKAIEDDVAGDDVVRQLAAFHRKDLTVHPEHPVENRKNPGIHKEQSRLPRAEVGNRPVILPTAGERVPQNRRLELEPLDKNIYR
jgi:hypothetical protein